MRRKQRVTRYKTLRELREAVRDHAVVELNKLGAITPSRSLSPREKLLANVRLMIPGMTEKQESEWLTRVEADEAAWQRSLELDRLSERRVSLALAKVRKALSTLDQAAKDARGTGPLSTWAVHHAKYFVGDLSSRLPTDGPNQGETFLSRLVWNVYVDARDVLGLRRAPTERELALHALATTEYFPDTESSIRELTPNAVVKSTADAIRKLRKKSETTRRRPQVF